MNSITGNSNEVAAAAATSKNKSKSVETTGSIASNNYQSLFDIPVTNYDMFVPTNPFSLNIDYGNYQDQANHTLANNSTFMQGWANAMAALSECCDSMGGFSFGGASASIASSGGSSIGSCSSGGGFTSVG